MQSRFTGQTLFTAFEQFPGTPAYMTREQAELQCMGALSGVPPPLYFDRLVAPEDL